MPLHGFVEGDEIEQIVLQERVSTKSLAPAGSPALFTFDKSRAFTQFSRDAQNIPSTRAVLAEQSDAIIIGLQTYLSQNGWGEFPKPVRVEFDGTNNMVFFQNNEADEHPNTLVRGDFRRLLCAGRGAPTGHLFLPNNLTLDETLDLLFPPGADELNDDLDAVRHRMAVGRERFSRLARDRSSAQKELARILDQIAEGSGIALVQAPEGAGKTYALFNGLLEQRWNADAERYQQAIERGEDPSNHLGFTIIACGSHAQVEEKRAELLKVPNAPKSAVVLHSVSRLYRSALSEFKGLKPLTTSQAGRLGFRHLLEAIQAIQPDVYARTKELRDEAWRGSDGIVRFRQDAVVLMVHGLAKVWPHAMYTRAFLHPEFTDQFEPEEALRFAQQMNPYRVIYDEVTWQDLVAVIPEEEVQLAWSIRDACERATGKEWEQSPLAERVSSYESASSTNKGNNSDLSFEDIDELVRLKLQPKDRRTVDFHRYPFGKGTDQHNIYAGVHGDVYFCKARRWPQSLGCPVVILTTEDLPRLVARGIDQDQSIKLNYSVIKLTHTPHLFRDTVPLIFDERARMPRNSKEEGEENIASCLDLAEQLLSTDFDFVISDGPLQIDKSLADRVSSHRGARGRNDLKTQRIATILTYPGLQQYSDLAILGAAFNINDPIAMGLRDQVYQDLGRNLGFRFVPGQFSDRHVVFIKPALFTDAGRLSGQSNPELGHDRYVFQLVANQF